MDGFRDWAKSDAFPDRGRISLIEGQVLIDMNPERIDSHNRVKTEIIRVLATLTRETDAGQVFGDGAWVTNDEAELSTEPDAAFVSWRSLESGRGRIAPSGDDENDGVEVRGSPDMMLEVVSPSSVRKDTRLLPAAYFRAGVREFWLVDARSSKLEFQIFIWREAGYAPSSPNDGWLSSAVFDRQFRLERERDRRGAWRYTLQVR